MYKQKNITVLRKIIRITGFHLLLMMGPVGLLSAQSGVGLAGGHFADEQISVSYSVGQVFNTAMSQSDYYVSQGMQHPLLLLINEFTGQEMEHVLKVYPNPVDAQLHFEINDTGLEKYRVLLFDMQGQLLEERSDIADGNVLDMAHLLPGNYVVKVISNGNIIKTYKIIKSQ